ncbi:helix-turn-helix transcriptional regulator [Kitasatospora sp. NPDC048722]|uniref:response regulator transcription factor n=1 Tax=Kitasatospora sp. NPDC048722 TaxID=3155639 RepID=UPI0033D3AAF5
MFTTREREILDHLAHGHTSRAIARLLHLSHHTVETHIRNMRAKSGASSRTQLLAIALGLDTAGPAGPGTG